MNLSTKQKQTHRYRGINLWLRRWEGWGEKDWEIEVSRCKLLYIELINKILLYSTGDYI